MNRPDPGFTLIELVVALAIFALFATLAYGGLRHVLHAKTAITSHQDRIAVLEDAFVLLESDLSNVVARGARDELGSAMPALWGPPNRNAIEFTRYVDDSYDSHPSVRLKRISYELQGDELVRVVWPVLDRVQSTVPRRRILVQGIASVAFRFHGNEWLDYWPPIRNAALDDGLPRAVEITLQFSNGDSARRILMLENQA